MTGKPKEDNQIAEVEAILSNLGYDLLPHGVCVASLEAWSGYSATETASRIALTTLALDVKDAYARTGDDIIGLMKFVPHARALIGVLAEFRDNGLMREELAQNDAKAIVGIVTVDQNQDAWIERVLADPVVGKERLAVSRISYD